MSNVKTTGTYDCSNRPPLTPSRPPGRKWLLFIPRGISASQHSTILPEVIQTPNPSPFHLSGPSNWLFHGKRVDHGLWLGDRSDPNSIPLSDLGIGEIHSAFANCPQHQCHLETCKKCRILGTPGPIEPQMLPVVLMHVQP